MNNSYNENLITICNTILSECNKYNISNHALTKTHKDDIFKETYFFPETITLSKRIKAIGNNDLCVCLNCQKIHGDIDSKGFCDKKCYHEYKTKNAIPDAKRKETLILKSKEKYKNLTEGYDYLICKECGLYAAELTTHITTHDLTPDEYKIKHDIKFVKCQKLIDSVSGENNPGFQHNGKFSAFSNNFIYSETTDREEVKRKAAKNRADNNGNTTTIEYWLKQTDGDVEKAKTLLKERQTTFSLEKCITKFGEEKGLELFLRRQERWLNTLSNKSKEEIDVINKKKSNQLSFHTLWKNGSHLDGELYLIKLPNDLYKIGITTKTVFDRYKKQSLNDCEILIQYSSSINHCFQIEQLIKKQFKSNTILKEEKYKDFGWTETFKNINESDLLKIINDLMKCKEHTTNLFKQNFKLNYSENF